MPSNAGNGFQYFTVWEPSTAEAVYIDVSSAQASEDIRTEGYEAFVINLSDGLVENTDWYYATSSHAGNLPVGWDSGGAGVAIDGGGNDWLLIGKGHFLIDASAQCPLVSSK